MKEAFEKIKDFLKSKFDYCAEQAGMNLDAECSSEIASYFRERKELYLDRANIYGEVMREVDRVEAEYGNGWIDVKDRLPEKDGYYLTCDHKGNIHVFYHHPSYVANGNNMAFGICKNHPQFYRPIAWMELPKPYKGV